MCSLTSSCESFEPNKFENLVWPLASFSISSQKFTNEQLVILKERAQFQISAIASCLKKDANFRISKTGSIKDGLKKIDIAYRSKHANRLAFIIKNHLSIQPRVSPLDALNNNAYQAAYDFRKKYAPNCIQSVFFKELQYEENCFRLGITSELANENGDFYKYAFESRLFCYLAYFDHRLKVQEINGKQTIMVLHKGEFTPWFAIPDELKEPNTFIEKHRLETYDVTGVVRNDRYNFDRLRVSKLHSPSPWGNRYLIKLSVHTPNRDSLTDTHSWWSLIAPVKPEHNQMPDSSSVEFVYSTYRPQGKETSIAQECNQPARESSPTWDFPYYEETDHLFIEISEQQFHLLLKFENSLGHRKKYPFHNLTNNCSKAALDRLLLLGYTNLPDIRRSFWRAVAPHSITDLTLAIHQQLPKVWQDRAASNLGLLGNYICHYFFKGSQIDPVFAGQTDSRIELKGDNCLIQPHLATLEDFKDPSKMDYYSPCGLSEILFKQCRDYRAKQKELFPDLDFTYAMPPEWRS